MTKRLSKADILTRAACETKDITVPEWAVGKEKPPTVTIKAWSVHDASMILSAITTLWKGGNQGHDLAPQIVAVSLVDPDTGDLMFGDEDGVKALCAMAPAGLVRVKNAALHFNKLGYLASDEEGEKQLADRIAAHADDSTEEKAEDPKN